MTAFPSRKRKKTSQSNSSIWWHKCRTALSPRTEPESRLPTLQPESWTYMTNTHTHKEQEMESEQLTIRDSSCTKKAATQEIGFPKLLTTNNRPDLRPHRTSSSFSSSSPPADKRIVHSRLVMKKKSPHTRGQVETWNTSREGAQWRQKRNK